MGNKPLDEKELNLQLKDLRLKVLREELLRFRVASIGVVAIAVATLGWIVNTALAKGFVLHWELVVLWGVAIICVALPLIGKLNFSKDGGGVEVHSPLDLLDQYEKKAQAARTEAFQQTQQAIGAVSQQLNEITKASTSSTGTAAGVEKTKSELTLREVRRLLPAPTDPEDPQRGRFGGSARNGTRVLEDQVLPSDIGSGLKLVVLTVRSTNGDPLEGPYAYFFLHDTFEPDAYRVKVRPNSQEVKFETTATGAFTAGVFAEGGKTILEVDISKNRSAPRWFREN